MPKICDTYGIVWTWTQSCRPSGQALPINQSILYLDLLPDDDIVLTKTGLTCFSDFLVQARNKRTNQLYQEFFGGGGGFLSVGGANPSYEIKKKKDHTGWYNPEIELGCRCSSDSCRVDCASSPDGFCCIDHSVTNRLLQVLSG